MKKLFQNVVLVVIVTFIILVLAKNIVLKETAVDNVTLACICLIISSVLVIMTNRLLKFMGEVMYLGSPLSKIDKMSGEEFEYYLKLKLQKLGYKVELTKTTGDYGADLFCFTKNETIVVQAKRYDANVGTAAVQEVVAAKEYYEADLCAVITNSYFTLNAMNLAEANGVVLIDRDELLGFTYDRLHRAV